MPVYEYVCDQCGNCFEQYRKPSERRLARCPQCRARARKVFRPVGIIFKGSGFYSTDYRKPEGKPAVAGKEPAASASDKPTVAGELSSD